MTDERVIVEFYGVPRFRAGRAELAVSPGSLAEVLAEVVARCPGLADLLTRDGRVSPHYLLSLDGQVFVSTLNDQIGRGNHLLLLSADAGG